MQEIKWQQDSTTLAPFSVAMQIAIIWLPTKFKIFHELPINLSLLISYRHRGTLLDI